jgi:cell division protein FtsL
VAKPLSRVQQRAKTRARSRTGIAVIVLCGLLLTGVVFVNLAVLRLNLRLDSANQERTKLKAENAALNAQLSAALASHRIQALAHQQDGLVQADPSSIGYIDLEKR